MATRYLLPERGFIGYNDRLAPDMLPGGYLADALNCFMRSGEIVKRKGYTLIADDLGSNACQGLKGVQFADGTKEVLAVFNGTIYKWTGSGSWSALSGSYTLSTSEQVDIVVANNAVYFFDGVNTVPKYNAATVSTVAAIPVGKFARWFHNQLHVAGMSANPNRLQSSDIGTSETFSGGNSSTIDVNPNDGDKITGMHELKDELIVFKRNRIWAMTGFGTTALTLAGLSERLTGFGALSHRSIINTGNDLLYIGFLGDKPIVRSLQRTRYGTIVDAGIISDDIEGTMNGLNKTSFEKTAGVFDGRYAWFAVPNGASTNNDLCLTYDTVTRGWMRHTGINAAVFDSFAISSQAQLYFGDSRADSKAYIFDTSTSDNGTAINFSVTTRRYGGDDGSIKKKFQWIYLFGDESGDYDVTIDYSTDGFDYVNLGTWNLTGTGSVFDNIVLDESRLGSTNLNRERFTIPKSRQYTIQFKMYDTSATSSIVIKNWDLYFFKKSPLDVV